MKVILLENVRKVGSIGEIIDVKRGYARNFLISKKKALFASKENIKEVEKIKQELSKKDNEKKKEAKNIQEKVQNKEFKNAFCAVRPPGHHAEKEKAMGFCVYNNVAVGAYYLLEKYNLKKSNDLDIPIIATHEVFYLDKEMYEAHDALICIGNKTYVNEKNRLQLSDQHYFKNNSEMGREFYVSENSFETLLFRYKKNILRLVNSSFKKITCKF